MQAENWKWWHFIVAGIGIGGYSIWQATTMQTMKPLGSLFLAVLCLVVGVWSRNQQGSAGSGEA